MSLHCIQTTQCGKPVMHTVPAQDRDFTIVFRSFGADIAQVIDEMNLFATGCHPNYPEVNPTAAHLALTMSLLPAK